MAHLEKHPTGWRVVWREGDSKSPRKVTSLVPTKAQALAQLAAIRADLRLRKPLAPGTVLPWTALVQQYLRSRSKTTEQHRQKIQKVLLRLSETHRWTSTGHIQAANLPNTIPDYNRRVLCAFLRYASDLAQPVDQAALRLLKPRRVRAKPKRLLTSDELATLQARADASSPGNGALCHLISTYGHRSESLLSLPASAINLQAGTITIRVKSGDTISHPLLPTTQERLRPLCALPGPIFINHLGHPWPDAKTFAAWWGHTLAKGLGPGSGILGLRRAAITRMLALGLDAKTVAAITGHRTVSLLLNTYAQTDEQRKAQAITALSSALLTQKDTEPGSKKS